MEYMGEGDGERKGVLEAGRDGGRGEKGEGVGGRTSRMESTYSGLSVSGLVSSKRMMHTPPLALAYPKSSCIAFA